MKKWWSKICDWWIYELEASDIVYEAKTLEEVPVPVVVVVDQYGGTIRRIPVDRS